MGLREKASRYRIGKSEDIIENFELLFAGKTLTQSELTDIKHEIKSRISEITSILDRKLIDMNTLFEIGKELNSTLHVDDLMQIVIFTLMGQFQIFDVAIYFIRDSHTDLHAQKGFTDLPGFEFSAKFIDFIGSKDNALAVDELLEYPDEYTHLFNSGATLVIPVKGKNRLMGMIFLGAKMNNEKFADEEKGFSYTLASLAGIALDNARLYSELDKRYQELSTLYKVSNVINSSDDYDLVLALILETITTGFGVKKALVLSHDDNIYQVVETVGMDSSLKTMEINFTNTENKMMDDNVTGILDINPDLSQYASDFLRCLFIPLRSVAAKVGAIIIFEFDQYTVHPENTDLINLFSIIASQIAPPVFMTKLIKMEKEKIQDPFTPLLELINKEIEKVENFGVDITFAMLKLTNFNKYIEFYGGGKAFQKFDALSAKIKKDLPPEVKPVRYGSNRILFIMPAIAQTDFEDVKDSILLTSQSFFKDDQEVDIGIDFLSVKYPDDTEDKFAILSRIE
jgi:transcriptional regulator with GAF, ATPase, and Fis domain